MAADPGMNLNAIGQVALDVADLDAAVEFYGGKLGLGLIGRFPPGLAFFDCGDVRLMVSALSGGAPSGNSVMYFSVPDIRRGHEELKSRGVEFSGEPHMVHSADGYELLMAFFEDNEGNTLAIMEERGRLGG
jgi:catechol 2,3-dioxygenase-like lactoylglutathione lyase family enzyme